MASSDLSDWAALFTQPSEEASILKNLRRQKVRAFYPLLLISIRNQTRMTPLFPRYVFVQITDDNFLPDLRAQTCFFLTPAGSKQPARLPSEFIAIWLRHRIVTRQWLEGEELIDEISRVGKMAVITEGPFQSYIGTVVEEHEGRARLVLNILGREIPIPLPSERITEAL